MSTGVSRDSKPDDERGASPPVAVGALGMARILLRWSPVIVPLAILSLVFAIRQTSEIDPEHTSTVSVLLTGPNEARITDFETGEVNIEDVNPLNSLGGSFPTVAEVTAIAMSEGGVLDQLQDEGLSTNVVVWVESRSPIINVEAVHGDADVAAATTDRMVELIGENLQQRQDALEAPETDRITPQKIADSTVGGADFGGRTRVRIALAVVGLGLSGMLAFVLEGLYQLFTRARAAQRRRGMTDWTSEEARGEVPGVAAVVAEEEARALEGTVPGASPADGNGSTNGSSAGTPSEAATGRDPKEFERSASANGNGAQQHSASTHQLEDPTTKLALPLKASAKSATNGEPVVASSSRSPEHLAVDGHQSVVPNSSQGVSASSDSRIDSLDELIDEG